MKKMLILCMILTLCMTSMFNVVNGADDNSKDKIQVYFTQISSGTTDETCLQKMDDLVFKTELTWDKGNIITVLPQENRQVMAGVGGSMTETSAYVIDTLPADKKEEIYRRYFASDEAAYSLVRTHIGSCDFSTHEYSYAPDKAQSIATNLENFSVAEDEPNLIPALKKALSYQPNLKIFSAPWAPPAWMKVSGKRPGDSLINVGSISTKPNHMDPQYYSLYATYLVKYLQEYAKRGIPIYSLSMQNESQNNPDWESCYWSTDQAITFIKDHLGPQLEAAGLQDIELLIWDWDRQEGSIGKGDGFLTFNRTLLASQAAPYIDGVAFHWYGPLDYGIFNQKRGNVEYENIATLKKEYPNMSFFATEACEGIANARPGKGYVYDIINDFQAGTNGWMDWNMVLDHKGGPLHTVKNNCHAPIVVNTETKEVMIHSEFYVMKHFSRTIRPGDIRIESTSTIDTNKDVKGLHQVAFLDKETNKIKLVVGNVTNTSQQFIIREGGRVAIAEIPAATLATYEFSQGNATNYEVALDKPATASTYENNPIHDYRPFKAFDNDKHSRWACLWDSHKEWIQVDLGLEMAVSGVDLTWNWGWKNDYAIQVSQDGKNWVAAVTVNGTQSLTNNVDKYYPMTLNFNPINGRYVRLQGITNRQGYGYSLYDIQVAASGPNALLALKDTSAVNKPSQASSYEGNPIHNYRSESAFDESDSTRWASAWNSDNEWVQVDLGQVENTVGFLLNWNWGWENIYEIQLSIDGVNWKAVKQVDISQNTNEVGNKKRIRLCIEPEEGRYVRMQGVKNKQGYGYSIYDFKVYTIE